MRVVSSVMCVLKFGSKPRPQADPGHNSKSGRVEPRRHRTGSQRCPPMQAKLFGVTSAPISETDDTSGARLDRVRSDGTVAPQGTKPQGTGPTKGQSKQEARFLEENRRCFG